MKKIVTFGEVMLRLSPPGFLRFTQARSFDVSYGGGEANVAASLAQFGLPAAFVTRLPKNDLGEACLQYLRQYDVDLSCVLRGGDRLGIYFLEQGAVQRGSKVVYDRGNSSFAMIQPGMIDWDEVFRNAGWFHWTGITPAISQGAAQACLEALHAARRLGLTVSGDLNYRAKLWKWGRPAGEVMQQLVALCDMVIANEEDAAKVFDIHAPQADVSAGQVPAEQYHAVCAQLSERFPNLLSIAITLRGSLSASHNTWSGLLWQPGAFYHAPLYDVTHIVDRVGGGDSFAAGLIYGLLTWQGDPQRALNFATAASALKHTMIGDINLASVDEVLALMGGQASGRVNR